MTHDEIIDKTGLIYARYYRRMVWLGIHLAGLTVSIIFIVYGMFKNDGAKIAGIAMFPFVIFLYTTFLTLGLDPAGDYEPSPWQERNDSIALLR